MDRKTCVIGRTREIFGDRLESVARVVEHDWDAYRTGSEPGHIGGVLRRSFGEAIQAEAEAAPKEVSQAEAEYELGVENKDWPHRREEMERILKSGYGALDRLVRSDAPDLSRDELVGLECCLALYGRPAILVSDGRLAPLSEFWKSLEAEREYIELAQRAVGRIELLGHPEYDWGGTGFLVGETTLMTTRYVAEIFSERRDGHWEFRPGVSAWLDTRSRKLHPSSAGCRVEGIIAVEENLNLALLRVERPTQTDTAPIPLKIAARAPSHIPGHAVYMVGYPVRDSRQNEPCLLSRIFRDVYDVKRVYPGTLRGEFQFGDVPLFKHDCGMVGNISGGCILDIETHEVLGLHVAGRSMDTGTALALWKLRDCPVCKNAGVNFAETDAKEIEWTKTAVEKIAQTSHWTKFHALVEDIYRKEFCESKVC